MISLKKNKIRENSLIYFITIIFYYLTPLFNPINPMVDSTTALYFLLYLAGFLTK